MSNFYSLLKGRRGRCRIIWRKMTFSFLSAGWFFGNYFLCRSVKLTMHNFISTYLHLLHSHRSTQTHTLQPDSWCASCRVDSYSVPLWKVSGWLLSDVRLICNSSPFCSDKWVGVLSFQDDRWGREGQGRCGNNTTVIMFFLHDLHQSRGLKMSLAGI